MILHISYHWDLAGMYSRTVQHLRLLLQSLGWEYQPTQPQHRMSLLTRIDDPLYLKTSLWQKRIWGSSHKKWVSFSRHSQVSRITTFVLSPVFPSLDPNVDAIWLQPVNLTMSGLLQGVSAQSSRVLYSVLKGHFEGRSYYFALSMLPLTTLLENHQLLLNKSE